MDDKKIESYEIDCANVKISPDVVSAIAAVATTQIKGIFDVAQNITNGIAELLGKKNLSKGIKVDIEDGAARIDAYIIVKYGAVIPDVATQLQDKIKTDVENMTGITVEKVNVHVQGVHIESPEPAPQPEPQQAKAPEQQTGEDEQDLQN